MHLLLTFDMVVEYWSSRLEKYLVELDVRLCCFFGRLGRIRKNFRSGVDGWIYCFLMSEHEYEDGVFLKSRSRSRSRWD
jgi:hypothetical protein